MLMIFDLIVMVFCGILIATKDQICHAFAIRIKIDPVAMIITKPNLSLYNIAFFFFFVKMLGFAQNPIISFVFLINV